MGWYTVIVIILIIHKIINLIFYPLKYTSPALGLLFTSLLTALLILTIFRLTSNQKKIKWAKDKVKAYILEIRLYRDQPRVILKALGNILLFNSMYLRYVLVPFLFIFIPVIFIIINLNFRYQHSGLLPEKTFLIKIFLNKTADPHAISIDQTENFKIDPEALFIPTHDEINYKLLPLKSGRHDIIITLNHLKISKTLFVGDKPTLISPARVDLNFWEVMSNPIESPLPKGSPIKRIEVIYPLRENSFLGIRIHWLLSFFVLSLLFALILKIPMKVEI